MFLAAILLTIILLFRSWHKPEICSHAFERQRRNVECRRVGISKRMHGDNVTQKVKKSQSERKKDISQSVRPDRRTCWCNSGQVIAVTYEGAVPCESQIPLIIGTI